MAHDPGLSLLEVQLFDNHLDLSLTFAQADLESVIHLDQNDDSLVSQAELDAAKADLADFLEAGINLESGQHSLKPNQLELVSAPSNTVKALLRFKTETDSQISLTVPLISLLARGHRQHLTVINSANQAIVQQILSKDSEAITLSTNVVSISQIFQQYFVEGVWHIWIGFDHILFLVTLLLPAALVYRNSQWQQISQLQSVMSDTLKIVTMFTLAHSITLSMAALNIVQISSSVIEPVIAFSVLVTSLNNLKPLFHQTRWLLAFVFGLIHGFGFAAVLAELGLNNQALLSSLIGFNLGVEAGQLAIVCLFIPVAYLARHTRVYRQVVFKGGSVLAALIAFVWMLERIAGFELFDISRQYLG